MSSSTTGILLSTFSGSVAKSALPSSDRLNTDGTMALPGESTSSMVSLVEPAESGESLQARSRSTSGGQVRVEITSAIEVGWLSLGVGIEGDVRIKERREQTLGRSKGTATKVNTDGRERRLKEKTVLRTNWDGVMRATERGGGVKCLIFEAARQALTGSAIRSYLPSSIVS